MYQVSIADVIEVAETKANMDGWQGYQWQAMDGGSTVKGCVPDGVYSRGPRKGRPRFSRPIAGSVKTVVVSDEEMQRYAADYVARTGNCFECKGSGERFAGWCAEKGGWTKPCDRCADSRQAETSSL